MVRRPALFALLAPGLVGGALFLSAGTAFAASQTLTAELSGANESPAGDAATTGKATVTIDTGSGQVCATVTSNAASPVAMHIHKGAAGANGDVVVQLDAKSINKGKACVSAKATVAQDIVADPAGYYVNIHTPAKPAGALRGQLAAAAPSGVNAGSGGQAATPQGDVVLVGLLLAGAGLTLAAGWRLARR